jgi:hypothetical protein
VDHLSAQEEIASAAIVAAHSVVEETPLVVPQVALRKESWEVVNLAASLVHDQGLIQTRDLTDWHRRRRQARWW